MKPADRAKLTTALRDHVAKVAEDLRAKMRAEGPVRESARRLHADEQVGEDFDGWTDLLARRAAVLWVLKSVYVRVLEDRGLLTPGRVLDVEAQQLFERLAPNLGETAFLRWVYRDLASAKGGLPELFGKQPAEVVAPSDVLSRELLGFWRHRDPDTGTHWNFAEEKFEGELMGDLYQELDPVVKDRFALCQTPDFVRDFMLDRTLTPATETYGAGVVRLLDPACGSGHFLIDGLKRLVAATARNHSDWDRKTLVVHCLERVVGIDLNDYACALARARLVMTAAELARVGTLADAAQFNPNVYWADALEQVERGVDTRGQQLDLLGENSRDSTRASLSPPETRLALRKILEPRFHVVVANPPYILEGDKVRKEYHRANVGGSRRYMSATGKYSLSGPFIERVFQVGVPGAFVGLITSNNFLKRQFGKSLIEKVLPAYDLTLVVDSSQAVIPHHGTPTILLFARNRRPKSEHVRAVMSKRAEVGTPSDPARGHVWRSIEDGWMTVGYDNEFVTVGDLSRESLAKHPWNLSGGGKRDLKQALDASADTQLGALLASSGIGAVTGADDVFLMPPDAAARRRLNSVRPMILGDEVRDFSAVPTSVCVFPYNDRFELLPESEARVEVEYLSRCRPVLEARKRFGVSMLERGALWYELQELYPQKYAGQYSILFPNISSNVHFALDRGGSLFNSTAQVMKLPPQADEDAHLRLLGLLNSSVACFWVKSVFHPKSHAGQKHHPDPSRAVYQVASTGLNKFPVPRLGKYSERLADLAGRLDLLARARAHTLSSEALSSSVDQASGAKAVAAALQGRWEKSDEIRDRMVLLQEELDWTVYCAYGLASEELLAPRAVVDDGTCPRGDRPFERLVPRRSTVRARKKTIPLAEAEVPSAGTLTHELEETWRRRIEAIKQDENLSIIEQPVFKRSWRDTDQNVPEAQFREARDRSDLHAWLAKRIELWARSRGRPFSVRHAASHLQSDPSVIAVVEVLQDRADFSLEQAIRRVVCADAVPQAPMHVYTESGLAKHRVWAEIWTAFETGIARTMETSPPVYSQGSRGKSSDFVRVEYWRLRGKFDAPKERFVALTEIPGRSPDDTLYDWAGWTPLQRVKTALAIDEELEDSGVPLADRIALLDCAWRLLPAVAREDATAASRLRAELQALLGPDGPSTEMLDGWRERFPPPGGRGTRKGARATKKTAGRLKRSVKQVRDAGSNEAQEEK